MSLSNANEKQYWENYKSALKEHGKYGLIFSEKSNLDGQFLIKEFQNSRESSKSGAISINRDYERGLKAQFFIEQQRYGSDIIETGILLENPTLIADGIRFISWGLAQQDENNSFSHSSDTVHSSSYFIEAASLAGLALKKYDKRSYKATLQSWKEQINRVTEWFIQADHKGRDVNLEPFHHRYYLRAATLQLASQFTKNRDYELYAKKYMFEGLSLQPQPGVTLERGIYDASYHMCGINFASRYLLMVRNQISLKEKKEIVMFIQHGISHFLKNVNENGEILLNPNSRTALELSRSGNAKRIDMKHISQALVFGSKALGMTESEDILQKIFNYYNLP